MKRVPLAAWLVRAHPADADALAVSELSGGWRWDDFRSDEERRFHVLYTAESAEGALIEKFQRFANDNAEALALQVDGDDSLPELPQRTVPASVLRGTVITTIAVIDPMATVADPFDHDTLLALAEIARSLKISLPNPMKAGDLGTGAYDVCQRVSAIIHDTSDAVGIVSRSSLDNPRSEVVHTNYSLFRALPRDGSALRVGLRRTKTSPILEDYPTELLAACRHLGIEPGLPLSHPEMYPIDGSPVEATERD